MSKSPAIAILRTVHGVIGLWVLSSVAANGQGVALVPLAEVPNRVAAGEQPRVRGVMTADIVRGYLFIEDASGAICLRLGDSKSFVAGDLVEATVKAYDARDFWYLADTAVLVEKAEPPEPEVVAGNALTVEWHNGRSVSMSGHVLSNSRTTRSHLVDGAFVPVTYDVITVDCGGIPVRLCFDLGTDLRERCLEGSLVRFSGSARVHDIRDWPVSPYAAVWIDDPGTVEILALPALFERREVRKVARIGAQALLAAGLLALLAFLLHRRRLRQLQDRYDEMEGRVAERTEELREALERERKLGLVKSDFVSLVSHEFRTPLGVIMSATDVLRRYFDRLDPEKRQRHLEMVCNATGNLAAMVDEVLLLGQMDDGRVTLAVEALDLERLCRVIGDELNSATRGIAPIHFEAATPLEGACGDESLLRHMLSNLLSNACKYSHEGEPVRFEVAREGGIAKFVIADRGIGIPEEDRARLFNTFTRGSNVGEMPGTGLGLVIVKRCVDLHGGTLTLDSRTDVGTTATVLLPLFAPIET